MAPLFQLQTNGLLQLSYRADVDSSKAGPSKHDPAHSNTLCHTEHSTTLTCLKCTQFYEAYIKVSPAQAATLMEETRMQSASQLWHDAGKLRLTASTAKRVPKRSTTDPQKCLNEHLYPTFTGNTATQHGKENETNVTTLMESRGHTVEKRGLVVHPDHPWLGASPDGILDSTQLPEIKCPFKSSMSLAEFLGRPNGDIKRLALKGGYTEVVKELLKRNPNVNLTDKDGNTVLMIADKEGYTEIVQDLLDAGRSGDTVLITAVRGGQVEIVRALLHKYADIDIRGQVGMNMVEFLDRAESTKTHPFVMAMGNAQQISQSFVIINGQALEQSTLLAAVDVCFKAFHVFDMNYPKQCASTWEFLQHVIFKMEGN
ncbi:unnamed protein product [Leuciscus chuanchicus]